MNRSKNLLQALKKLDSLPAIPDIARKILSLKLNTDEDNLALFELIVKDPPIMSKIIGLSNSPLFNSGRKITKLEYAVALLGSRRVKMIALSFSVISAMARNPAGLLNTKNLWKHSLAIAMTMDILARFVPQDRRPPDEDIYLAGLLHDIGFLVLDYLDPQLSDKFHAQLAIEPLASMQKVEEEILGISHGELGMRLGRYWNLPAPILTSMNFHHAFNENPVAVPCTLGSLANLAEKMLPALGVSRFVPMEIVDQEWHSLGIDPLSADVIKAKVKKITMEVSAAKL